MFLFFPHAFLSQIFHSMLLVKTSAVDYVLICFAMLHVAIYPDDVVFIKKDMKFDHVVAFPTAFWRELRQTRHFNCEPFGAKVSTIFRRILMNLRFSLGGKQNGISLIVNMHINHSENVKINYACNFCYLLAFKHAVNPGMNRKTTHSAEMSKSILFREKKCPVDLCSRMNLSLKSNKSSLKLFAFLCELLVKAETFNGFSP